MPTIGSPARLRGLLVVDKDAESFGSFFNAERPVAVECFAIGSEDGFASVCVEIETFDESSLVDLRSTQAAGDDSQNQPRSSVALRAVNDSDVKLTVIESLPCCWCESGGFIAAITDEDHPDFPVAAVDGHLERFPRTKTLGERYNNGGPLADLVLVAFARFDER